MVSTINKKEFMTNEVMNLLKNLKADTVPNFGLMTAQHMVEHLVWTLKSAVKRNGEPEESPTEKQLGFQKFIKNGSVLKHRSSEKTKADLPELRFENIELAKEQIEVAVSRFYNHFEANPSFKSYNKFSGELSFDDLELFHFMHYRYHLWQFGLIEKYP